MKNIFISDLHMGVNYKTNIYQQTFHEPYLKTILRYIQNNASNINDVVILGDWFDFWMYPSECEPPTVADIINANLGVFNRCSDGDFVSCMDSIQGNLVYVSGNHDMTLDVAALQQHFASLSSKGKALVNQGNVYVSGNIHAEHGNAYTYFNAVDNSTANRYAPLPIGFYMTRIGAVSCENSLGGATNCSQVAGNDYPSIAKMLEKELLPYAAVLANPIVDAALVALAGFRPSDVILDVESDYAKSSNTAIQMANGTSISVKDAADMLSYLRIDTESDIKGILADSDDDLHSYAQTFFSKQISVVIMGHTHVPCLNVYPAQGVNHIYANSGFIAPDQPSMKAGSAKVTFVEVDDSGSVCVQEVQYDNTIVTLNIDSTIQDNLPFTYSAGAKSGTLTGGLLVEGGGSLLVNYNGTPTKLSSLPPGSVIPGVSDIQLQSPGSVGYGYRVVVTAISGGATLEFTDQSPDTYKLSIDEAWLTKTHEVSFNSSNPSISQIAYVVS